MEITMKLFNKDYKKELETIKQDELKPYIKETDIQPDGVELQNLDLQKHTQKLQDKKILNRTGFALSCMAAVVLGSQLLMNRLVSMFCPWVGETNWYVWLVTAVSIIGIGFPVYYILMRRIPDSPKGEVVPLSPLRFLMLFIICCGAMYITNILSSVLTIAIALLKGDKELLNPAQVAIFNSNIILSMIYASLVAPVFEELIFRKLLLDKLRRFGDLPAMLMSGIAFGLFHLNLSQFFYAAVLGIIFAYITLKTNTVRYSIMLHMIVNFLGVMASVFVTSKNIFGIIIFYQWVFSSIIAGIILFIFNYKKISLVKAENSLLRKSDFIKNPGIILYLVICIVMIVIMTIIPA
jgi:membrane protease YdiL (CAAX protease family)